MHMAAACGVPTVTLFGPTDPGRWKPWGREHVALYDETLSCRPCEYRMTCRNRECLTEFPPERILAAVRAVLAKTAARPGRPV
jgi:ADP-heptose:LPS heptosyltransferase